MARILKGSHSFTCTPRVHPLTEWAIPAFAFPAEAGTYLPTPEGWKAELALGGCLVTYRNIWGEIFGSQQLSNWVVVWGRESVGLFHWAAVGSGTSWGDFRNVICKIWPGSNCSSGNNIFWRIQTHFSKNSTFLSGVWFHQSANYWQHWNR